MIKEQLKRLIGRPGAYFGYEQYSFKEVISLLNGYVLAQKEYSNIDEGNYMSYVINELSHEYNIDSYMHIVDLFNLIYADNSEEEKTVLLYNILNKYSDTQNLKS